MSALDYRALAHLLMNPVRPIADKNPLSQDLNPFGLTEGAMPYAGGANSGRFAAGRALNSVERDNVLKTLSDVYKENGVQKVSKGSNAKGEEIFGYPHVPELFITSDITGKPVRYYVTLPDGKKAHPTELFPEYTQSHIDAAMSARAYAAKQAKASAEQQLANQFDSRADANYFWNMKAAESARKYGRPTVNAAPNRMPLVNKAGKMILVPKESGPDLMDALAEMGWTKP